MSQNALAAGIVNTANALGMSPVDLATIMSYETAGTFDPSKAGPTTQWGQHRGLIQFGEPQAQQYGVDWQNPVASQLGPDGAVAQYFRAHGWQPGMSMLDAYSVVNAGAPGRYNASDANNGGAPGTVADKVNNQMAAHRANAERLLAGYGGEQAPQQAPQQGMPQQQGQPQMGQVPQPNQMQAPQFQPIQGYQMTQNALTIQPVQNPRFNQLAKYMG